MKILMINWDNYPNVASGGVYSWEKFLIEGMRGVQFSILNQLSNSNASANYDVPEYVERVMEIPLFGTNRLEEFSTVNNRLGERMRQTTQSVITKDFIPLFKRFVQNILAQDCNFERTADSIYELHKFLVNHDLKKCFENTQTWQIYLEYLRTSPDFATMSLNEALNAFRTFQRGLQIISFEMPKVDLVHCSLAWFPSFAAICAKREYGCPVVVTEHGVAYREQLLNFNLQLREEVDLKFWKRLAHNIIMTVYHEANAIVPVCASNAVWEIMMGVDQSKIRVIYNGIDTNRFRPLEVERVSDRPTVVSIARIDVWKDIPGLIHAINIVREDIPNVVCQLYGQAVDLSYAERCQSLVKELHLEENFKFMGRTKQPEVAYNSGDLVVFTGITEGFPFSVIEAMACGKPLVAANVGGVGEALEGCGLLVQSLSPRDLANKIIQLLRDEQLRKKLGLLALERARERFSIEASNGEYSKLYRSLLSSREAGGSKDSIELSTELLAHQTIRSESI